MHQVLALGATLAVLVALSGIVPLVFVNMALMDDSSASNTVALGILPEARSRPAGDGEVRDADIEALTLDSDFTVFVKADCPLDRHRAGLRKLWSLIPTAPVSENSPV